MTYVYAANGMTPPAEHAGDVILAYEHLGHHVNQGMHFLYAGGHVEFQTKVVAEHFVSEIAAGHNPPGPMPPAPRR